MSERYRPANGTEGEIFKQKFCRRCARDQYPDEPFCDILTNTTFYAIDDEEYPNEWTYDENGKPTCTAFEEDTENE